MVVVSTSFTAPVDGILFQSLYTKLRLNQQEVGTATLYITENSVIWGGGVSPTGGEVPTISLLYPNISLHAIQRDPAPALYMVVNHELRLPGIPSTESGGGDNDDEEFDADYIPITQLWFVPPNETDLQPMYSAMIEGQSLHPDPADEVDEDEPFMDGEDFDDGDDQFEDAQEIENSPEGAAARLRQLNLENSNGNHFCDDGDEDAEIGED